MPLSTSKTVIHEFPIETDVDQNQHVLAESDHSADTLISLIQGMPTVAALVDRQHQLIAFSEPFSRLDLLGSDNKSLRFILPLGCLNDDLVSTYDSTEDLNDVINNGTSITRPLTLKKETTEDVHMDIHYNPWYSTRNTIEGVLVMFTDTTDQTLNSRNLREINDELTQLQYHLSHDLVAPIASARGLLHLVKDDLESNCYEELPELISETEGQLLRLDTLVSDLMSLARAGASNSTISTFGLRELIDDIMVSLNLHSRELELSVTLQPTDFSMKSDRVRVKQILTNLISNARKFQDVNEAAPQVIVRAEKSEIGTILEVVDNGSGINRDIAETMFDMFVRGSSEHPGNGLGLYIVRKHVAHLGGTLSVTSLQKPTIFRIVLPFAELDDQ